MGDEYHLSFYSLHALQGILTPDQVYRTASGGGARIVDKYSEAEKTHSGIERRFDTDATNKFPAGQTKKEAENRGRKTA